MQGADAVYVYEPTTQQYTRTTTLQPGQGAWAHAALTNELSLVEQSPSAAGEQVTILGNTELQ